MEDSDRVLWNRHYDSVQWTAITVFTGILALLLGYSYAKDFQPNPSYFLIGWWITNLRVYFATSFREFRRHLVLQIPDIETCKLLTDDPKQRRLPMWPAFLFTFALFDAIWLIRYAQTGCVHQSIAVGLGVVTVVFLLVAKHRGRTAKYKETIPGKLNTS